MKWSTVKLLKQLQHAGYRQFIYYYQKITFDPIYPGKDYARANLILVKNNRVNCTARKFGNNTKSLTDIILLN